MGGRGSGAQRGRHTHIVEKVVRLDITDLRRVGLFHSPTVQAVRVTTQTLDGGSHTVQVESSLPVSHTVRLSYQIGTPAQAVLAQVSLLATLQTYGGRRWWFACPRCQRRCGVLYLPVWAEDYGCRACHSLRYAAQYESPSLRAWRQAEKALRQIDDLRAALAAKPNGKHLNTFLRLQQRALAYMQTSLATWPMIRTA